MFKRYALITAAMAGFAALFMPLSADAAPVTAPTAATIAPVSDCYRVAPADRNLCRTVRAQHPYGWTDSKGNPQTWVPSGKVVVREITHQGLTKAEMRDYLKAADSNFRGHVTQIKINSDAVLKRCGSDGTAAVSFVDEDGKPGGRKYIWTRIICA